MTTRLSRLTGTGARWALTIGLVSLLGGASLAQVTSSPVETCSQVDQPAKAIAGCSQLLAGGGLDRRTRAAVHHLRGVAHHNAGSIGLAMRDFAEAHRLDPDEAAPVAGLALATDELDRRCRADGLPAPIVESCSLLIEHAASAGLAPPAVAALRIARGLALERLGKSEEAVADMRAALAQKDGLAADLVARAERVLQPPAVPQATATVAVTVPATEPPVVPQAPSRGLSATTGASLPQLPPAVGSQAEAPAPAPRPAEVAASRPDADAGREQLVVVAEAARSPLPAPAPAPEAAPAPAAPASVEAAAVQPESAAAKVGSASPAAHKASRRIHHPARRAAVLCKPPRVAASRRHAL